MTRTESRPPKQESASRSEVDYRMKYVIERDLRTAPSKIHLHTKKKSFLKFQSLLLAFTVWPLNNR